jgi:polysaccharide pyruvyl transferase CsaB
MAGPAAVSNEAPRPQEREITAAPAPGRAVRVGISGSYGGMNLGDEAILQAIIAQLRAALAVEITVFSREATDTMVRHKVERAVPVRDLSRDEILPEIEALDLLILGGGGILFDAEASIYLREVALAHQLKVPVMVYAVGAGPLQDPSAQTLVREALAQAAAVTVRERRARQVLEEVGVNAEIEVTADPALLLEPEPVPRDTLKREGLDGGRRLIGLSVREPGVAAPDIEERHYHALLANAADSMVDRLNAELVFVPMERRAQDAQHAHAVVSQMAYAQRATVLKGEYTSGQLLSLMSHFSFAVGMRLHFLIFAALARVPFVALPYAGKVLGFLEDLQIDMPPLTQVKAGQLIAYIDRSWDLRREMQGRLEQHLPALQARARRTHEIALTLLTEPDRRTARRQAAGADP